MLPNPFARAKTEAADANRVAALLKEGALDEGDPKLQRLYREAMRFQGAKILVTFAGGKAEATGIQAPYHEGLEDTLRICLPQYEVTTEAGLVLAKGG